MNKNNAGWSEHGDEWYFDNAKGETPVETASEALNLHVIFTYRPLLICLLYLIIIIPFNLHLLYAASEYQEAKWNEYSAQCLFYVEFLPFLILYIVGAPLNALANTMRFMPLRMSIEDSKFICYILGGLGAYRVCVACIRIFAYSWTLPVEGYFNTFYYCLHVAIELALLYATGYIFYWRSHKLSPALLSLDNLIDNLKEHGLPKITKKEGTLDSAGLAWESKEWEIWWVARPSQPSWPTYDYWTSRSREGLYGRIAAGKLHIPHRIVFSAD